MIDFIDYEYRCRNDLCGENGKLKRVSRGRQANGTIEQPGEMLCGECGRALWLANKEVIKRGSLFDGH